MLHHFLRNLDWTRTKLATYTDRYPTSHCCLRCWKKQSVGIDIDWCETVRVRSVAYRKFHSIETVILLRITSDLISHLDKGDVALMAFLDLTAAFDARDTAEPFVNFIRYPWRCAEVDQIVFDESH